MSATRTILLDGWLGSASRLGPMRRNLEALTGPTEIWLYNTSGKVDLEAIGAQFAEYLSHSEQPVHLVGFSMGGIVIREALRQKPNLSIRSTVFLHSPHHGTLLAHLLPFLPAVAQMRPGCDFLRRLQTEPWSIPTMNVWCPGDSIVVPGSNSRWNRAGEEHCCRVPAHVLPIFSKAWHRRIAEFHRRTAGSCRGCDTPVAG